MRVTLSISRTPEKGRSLHISLIIVITSVVILSTGAVNRGLCQYSSSVVPVSYFYTNPLFFTGFGYINSIIEPFYYMGYGYYPPIEGNTLLGWDRYTPFNNAYASFLLNFFEIPTYPYFGSVIQTTFPYRAMPGTGYPYARFEYPTYSYGSVSAYQGWVGLQ
ncbi:MAG: hypothetical protein ACMUIS_09410 [bacterium]